MEKITFSYVKSLLVQNGPNIEFYHNRIPFLCGTIDRIICYPNTSRNFKLETLSDAACAERIKKKISLK